MNIEETYKKALPTNYLKLLKANPKGWQLTIEIHSNKEAIVIEIFSEAKLLEILKINHIGTSMNFECLKLFIKFQRDYGYADIETPNLSESEMDTVEAGFVFGGDYDGYIYFDPSDNNSVWLYYAEDGHIEKVAESFDELLPPNN